MISVVVITYNSENTIIETLDSIYAQTFRDFEIVVSDDCSTDNTVEVVETWLTSHNVKGLVVLSEANKGIPANANKGIRNSNGDLIKIIAGDDVMYPNALEVYKAYYDMDENVIWQSRHLCFGKDKEKVEISNANGIDEQFYVCDNIKQYRTLLVGNRLVAPAIGLIKREYYDVYGFYDERYGMMEDYPFFLNLSKNGIPFRLINDVLIGYRISDSSVMGMGAKAFYKCMADFYFSERILGVFKFGGLIEFIKQTLKFSLIKRNLLIMKVGRKYKLLRM